MRQGMSGKVHSGVHKKTGQKVAVKVIDIDLKLRLVSLHLLIVSFCVALNFLCALNFSD